MILWERCITWYKSYPVDSEMEYRSNSPPIIRAREAVFVKSLPIRILPDANMTILECNGSVC